MEGGASVPSSASSPLPSPGAGRRTPSDKKEEKTLKWEGPEGAVKEKGGADDEDEEEEEEEEEAEGGAPGPADVVVPVPHVNDDTSPPRSGNE